MSKDKEKDGQPAPVAKNAQEEALIKKAEEAKKAEAELRAKDEAQAKAKADEEAAAKLKADKVLSEHFTTFWLTKSRYLQQAGDHEPQMVEASPQAPVAVVLPAKVRKRIKVKEKQVDDSWSDVYRVIEVDHPEDAFLTKAPQIPPRDVRPGLRAPKAVAAHEHFRQAPPPVPALPSSVRAADK